MTVRRQSIQLRYPSIISTDKTQVTRGKTTQRNCLKITARVAIINNSMPAPKIFKSLLIKSTMSAVIMLEPPRNTWASPLYLDIFSRISATLRRSSTARRVR